MISSLSPSPTIPITVNSATSSQTFFIVRLWNHPRNAQQVIDCNARQESQRGRNKVMYVHPVGEKVQGTEIEQEGYSADERITEQLDEGVVCPGFKEQLICAHQLSIHVFASRNILCSAFFKIVAVCLWVYKEYFDFCSE